MENAWQLVATATVLVKEKKVLDGATFGAYMIDTLRQRDLVFVSKDQTRKTLYSKHVIDELIEECLELISFLGGHAGSCDPG